jgi:hypothetical protein
MDTNVRIPCLTRKNRRMTKQVLETASNPDQVSSMVLRVDNHDSQKINIPNLG